MPKQQNIIRQARGLYTFANPINQVPPGALTIAKNCVIDGEYFATKRRGLNRFGDALEGPPVQLIDYRDRVVVQDGTTLKYDSDGSGAWVAWDGTFSGPDANTKIRGREIRSNLYFTTSNGIYRTDLLTNSPTKAGVEKGLAPRVELTGTGGSWFEPNNQVSYRITFLKKDQNENPLTIEGAPSRREIVSNPYNDITLIGGPGDTTVHIAHTGHGYSTGDIIVIDNITSTAGDVAARYEGGGASHTIIVVDADNYTYTVGVAFGGGPNTATGSDGKAFDVILTFPIPDEIKEGDMYQVYRTDLSLIEIGDPGGKHFLINQEEIPVTATDISNDYLTLADDGLITRNIELYTNEGSQEGEAQANDRPPYCFDIALFKGHTWYPNTSVEGLVEFRLLSITAITDDVDYVSISDGNNAFIYTFSGTEDISTQKFQRFTTGTLSENVRNTMKSLEWVINRDTTNSSFYAYYNSETNDFPGILLLVRKDLTQTPLSVVANTTSTGSKFAPTLPTTGDSVRSQNQRGMNRLYYSKFDLPDCVPHTSNYEIIGSELSPILRVLPLRDSLIVLKEEGVWRITGQEGEFPNWDIQRLDLTTRIYGPETAVATNNKVWTFADIGMVSAGDSGTELTARQLEGDLLRISKAQAFKNLSFAVGYENYKKVLLATQTEATDLYSTQLWVFDYLNEVWTTWDKPVSCGLVLFDTNELYLGHAIDPYVLKERKNLNSLTDYLDEDIPIEVLAVGTDTNDDGETITTLVVDYQYDVVDLDRGWLFQQGDVKAKIMEVSNITGTQYLVKLEAETPYITVDSAFATIPIKWHIRFRPEVCGAPAVAKQFSECQFYLKQDSSTETKIAFSSNFDSLLEEIVINHIPASGFGLSEFGEDFFGDPVPTSTTPLQVDVPRDKQDCDALVIEIKQEFAMENVELLNVCYTFRPYSDSVSRVS